MLAADRPRALIGSKQPTDKAIPRSDGLAFITDEACNPKHFTRPSGSGRSRSDTPARMTQSPTRIPVQSGTELGRSQSKKS